MENAKYDVFISYSRKDYVDEQKNVIPGNVVSKIKDALTKAGITYWFDEEGMYSGDNFVDKIVHNIKASKVFVFLSTKNANTSEWTPKEIATASELGKYIIPVRLDDSAYSEKVLFRIADLSFVSFNVNPEKGIKQLINSIKAYLAKSKEEMEKAEEKNREIDQKRLEDQKKQPQYNNVAWWQEYNMNPVRISGLKLSQWGSIFIFLYFFFIYGSCALIYVLFYKWDNEWCLLPTFLIGVFEFAFFIYLLKKIWFLDVNNTRKKRQELLDDDFIENYKNGVRYVLIARGTSSSHKFGLFDALKIKVCIPMIYDELKWIENGIMLHGVIDGNSIVVDINGNQYT